jgi:ankyrin repeat protein
MIYTQVRDLFLERYDGEFIRSMGKIIGRFTQDAMLQYLKFAAYLSSNNILPAGHIDRLLRWIIDNNLQPTLTAFCSSKTPTLEVFVRHIFESALRIQDTDVVQRLLEVGCDPSQRMRGGYTPLQVVSVHGYSELAVMLLD